jgi:hypothetical protein
MVKRLSLLLLLAACEEEEQVYYEQFNCSEDYTFIGIGADDVADHGQEDDSDECGELGMGRIELRSSTCESSVGYAIVDPCMAPIGTEHKIVVYIDTTQADKVDRVSVRVDAGKRGADEYTMDPDSADPGIYKTTLESVGSSGETREDYVQIKLFSVDPDGGEEE